jgi:L-amino acid N-acyltransferase YncA
MDYNSDPPIDFRPAIEADLPALTEIFNAAITGTTSTGHLEVLTVKDRRAWWDSHLDPRYPILTVERAGEVVGYASLSPWSPYPVYEQTVESSLYLAPITQGRGLGTALMMALLAEAKRLGHHVVLSRIWSQNAASLAMCRKCGYEVIGTQREVGLRNGVWEDCVMLQVIL